MSLRILLVGSGGREHALAWKLAQSALVSQIFVVPGNGGTAGLTPKVKNVSDVSVNDFAQLLKFAMGEKVNLLVPGPEAPLVDGIVDYFRDNGPASIACFGPSKAAARMEGSKAFSKDFMRRHDIPTAAYETFTSYAEAKRYLDLHRSMKIVIKASGLAAGKGVILPSSYEEATAALALIMVDRAFGAAGDSVVIEEFLEGEELSILSFTDGYTIRSLPGAQDHKQIYDGDRGPMTGGMGCYAPSPAATPALMERIHRETLQPTIDGMRNEGYRMVGCLFTGYMLTKDGPRLLEYNIRFGDPECQTLLPLLESDLAEVMLKCSDGWLSSIELKLASVFSTTVVVAAGGYPERYEKDLEIKLDKPGSDTMLFHAGTLLDPFSSLRTNGGRVIASTAIGSEILTAVERAYRGVACVHFERMQYRRDIAHRALNKPLAKPTTTARTQAPMTYASAGVSIAAGNSLVQNIKSLVRSTARPGVGAIIGGFGGELSLPNAGYPADSPTIVMAIDGIGTKVMIAQAMGLYSTVGIDLVAMNVNDLVVQGAQPLAFLDYYATGRLDVPSATEFVRGVADGCILANCGLVGGETAEMFGLYREGEFDAAGCAIGAIRHGKKILPDKDAMQAGDQLLGLASSGPHSNGYSLIRKILERTGLSYTSSAPWDPSTTVGQSLLTPTRIYVRSLLAALDGLESAGGQNSATMKGLAHITGGGLTENIPRMLPEHLAAELKIGSWPVPKVLAWLKREGNVESKEFARAFNTGLGMVCVVGKEAVEDVVALLEGGGESVYRVGKLIDRAEQDCILKGLEKWDDL